MGFSRTCYMSKSTGVNDSIDCFIKRLIPPHCGSRYILICRCIVFYDVQVDLPIIVKHGTNVPSLHYSFSWNSLCKTPLAAVIHCTSPEWITPLLPAASLCSMEPEKENITVAYPMNIRSFNNSFNCSYRIHSITS